ncbi:MAG: hypothetical protein WBP85_12150 [Terracidiphilus sp.]
MQRALRWAVLIAIASTASFACAKTVKVSGRIVAYNSGIGCVNGNVGWWVVLRAQKVKQEANRFVLLYFTQPCGVSPDQLIGNSMVRRYRLTRDKEEDAVLNEYVACLIDSKPPKPCPPGDPMTHTPIWERTPGAEDVPLPFGSRLLGYRSPDLPWVPLL